MRGRYFIAWVICIGFIFTCTITTIAKAELEDIKSEAYVLMGADSGKILYSKNEHKKLPPASMTKLMTLILAVDAIDKGKVKLSDKVVTSEDAWKMGGSQIYLEPGEEMTYEEMLIAIAVGSANDACVAVAEHLEGSHKDFVVRMNNMAKELGLKNTHFVNSNGLHDENHYSSAHDMAIIARKALSYPRIIEYTGIKEYDLRQGEFKLYNTNKLLWWYKGTDGFKTGWTNQAKYCLTSTVKRDGLRLISVVMASPEVRGHFKDSMEVLNYGFAKYAYKSFFARGSVCDVSTVGKGDKNFVELRLEDNAGLIYLKEGDSDITYKKVFPAYVEAPVLEGQKLGEIVIYKDGIMQKKVNLIAADSIAKGGLIREIIKMFSETYLL